jgi:DNA-binding NtrC family response regulator
VSPDIFLPRLLIIDDLFGRAHHDRRNEERANLCGQFMIEDVTGDEANKGHTQKIKHPLAQAVFCRGQKPIRSKVGDIVENDLEGTLTLIREGWCGHDQAGPGWSMILLDLCFYTGLVTEASNRKTLGMPEGRDRDADPQSYFGLEILRAIHYEYPELPVIILSSKPRGEVSREFSYSGALGFLAREAENSPELLREYIWRHALIPDETGQVVGYSKALLLALRAARRAASGHSNILIRGERGAGKELMARYIHQHGVERSKGPFVTVNSAALSASLYASELFGIGSRVASGVEGRKGLIEAADGGDIFFDEIGDMLPETQSGILRVLEHREVMPVGSKSPRPVDVRFISATNIDIESRAATESFRSDLLDRLREGGTIVLPPLKERKEDIPPLVERFVREAEGMTPSAQRRQIEPEALEKILTYGWPGNIRELRSCVFRAVNHQPDVEYLVPHHIQIPSARTENDATVSAGLKRGTPQPDESKDIEALINALDNFTFDAGRPDQLASKLPRIREAFARLLARYLKATLDVTSKPTPEHPAGKILIHPAVKLMEGDSDISASKAADVIKRILGTYPEAVAQILEDPVLREAYETALRLRPRQQKVGKKSPDGGAAV